MTIQQKKPQIKQVWKPIVRPLMEPPTKQSTPLIPSIVQETTHSYEGNI